MSGNLGLACHSLRSGAMPVGLLKDAKATKRTVNNACLDVYRAWRGDLGRRTHGRDQGWHCACA